MRRNLLAFDELPGPLVIGMALSFLCAVLYLFVWRDVTLSVHAPTYWVAVPPALAASALLLIKWFRTSDPFQAPYWHLKHDSIGKWVVYGVFLALVTGGLYFWALRGMVVVISQHSAHTLSTEVAAISSVRDVASRRSRCKKRVELAGAVEASVCVEFRGGDSVGDMSQAQPGDEVSIGVGNTSFTSYVVSMKAVQHGA